jgi:phosphatidate cytidylyltransferase
VSASKLQQRILTALLIVPLPVAAVLLLPTPYLALCLGLFLLFGAWEWATLAGISTSGGRVAYSGLAALCMFALWQPSLRMWFPQFIGGILVFWGLVALFLWRLRAIEHKSGLDPVLIPVGLLVLVGPWVAIAHLHANEPDGPYLVLFLLVLIWVADILAYFAGRQWGRSKLAPLLSPGKTRVGVYGALIGAALLGLVLGWGRGYPPVQVFLVVLLCALAAILSVIGDLFESLIKRRRQVKDSGSLLPGHGGVLDRIDSLTAAAPLFALGLLWLEAQS